MWAAEPEFVKQIIKAAPNLKNLRGKFSSDTLEGLPKRTFKLLEGFSLSIFRSAQEEKNCVELAEAGPALSNLNVTVPSSISPPESQFRQSFLQVGIFESIGKNFE